MSLTVRIVWQYILSRVHGSVRPSIFYTRKISKTLVKSGRQHVCLYAWPATGIVWPASKTGAQPWRSHGWAHRHSEQRQSWVGWGCACSRVWACVRVHACVRDVFAIYDNDILPRLIMIIIKIIILYFIQIRHTDDFPSTGTRLVLHKTSCRTAVDNNCSPDVASSKHLN